MASVIPDNQASFSHAELIAATSGSCPAFDGVTRGVGTDSRVPLGGGLFVALPGEQFDGHDFVAAAVRQGARVVMLERDVPGLTGVSVLRVPSTLRALGDLARYHRRRWGRRVVGVAGSVGKTTTRSSIAAVATGAGLRVHSPRGNLNNLVGVPLVLLGLTEHHELGVVELGTNQRGEIARLNEISQPDVAVLTRIAL
ncbi:MAG TPA: Mur ligase family protein, partial [Polyangiaceae bacterium]|nr:Mur ligase family protein [Polyangiaceae bacterium]